MSSLVNVDNSHPGNFLASNQGGVAGYGGKIIGKGGSCKGIKHYGGKRKRKSKKRGRKSKKHSKSKKGGAVRQPQRPLEGIKHILKRGNNASRGLSPAEKAVLKGGDNTTHHNKHKHKVHTLFGGGVGYGMTSNNAKMQANAGNPSGIGMGNHNNATVSVSGYKNCGIIPDFKLGASKNYSSLENIQIGAGASLVDKYNNMTNSGYGYLKPGSDGNRLYADSYAPVTSTSRGQKCGKGGKKKRGRKSRKGRKGRKSRKGRKGRKGRKSRKSRKMKRRSRKKQRGGYAQYMSNVPLTSTQSIPNGTQGGQWEGQLSSPPTFARLDLCQDNYNHFTGKTMPSPVLDQDVVA